MAAKDATQPSVSHKTHKTQIKQQQLKQQQQRKDLELTVDLTDSSVNILQHAGCRSSVADCGLRAGSEALATN